MSGVYRTIVADPPWDHSDGTGFVSTWGFNKDPNPNGEKRTRPPYKPMTIEEIVALPISGLADKDAHLYLWATNRYVRHAWRIAESWGFSSHGALLTWAKPRTGWVGGGAFPSDTEFCLFSRRGNLPTIGRAPGRWFDWPRRRGAWAPRGGTRQNFHSAKPEAFLDMVEQVSPGPYLELFARRNRLGWDTWGNQALNHVGHLEDTA